MAPTAFPTTIAPSFTFFVYFPSHHSLDLLSSLSFYLCLYSFRVYLFLLSPLTDILQLFDCFPIAIYIFSFTSFPFFLIFFLIIFIVYYLLASLLRFSFLVFPVFFTFILLSLLLLFPLTLNFFVFFTPLFLFVRCSTRSISSHSTEIIFFRLIFYFLTILSLLGLPVFFFPSCFHFLRAQHLSQQQRSDPSS